MNSINLNWKSFQVNLDKVGKYFKENLSSNYDGLLCNVDNLKVVFLAEVGMEDQAIISDYWSTITEATFAPTQEEVLTVRMDAAIQFGNDIIMKAMIEHMTLGITQAGKTKAVADLYFDLAYYLKTGSLYAALDEIDRLIAAGPYTELEPFVSLERMQNYKTKIQTYLGL